MVKRKQPRQKKGHRRHYRNFWNLDLEKEWRMRAQQDAAHAERWQSLAEEEDAYIKTSAEKNRVEVHIGNISWHADAFMVAEALRESSLCAGWTETDGLIFRVWLPPPKSKRGGDISIHGGYGFAVLDKNFAATVVGSSVRILDRDAIVSVHKGVQNLNIPMSAAAEERVTFSTCGVFVDTTNSVEKELTKSWESTTTVVLDYRKSNSLRFVLDAFPGQEFNLAVPTSRYVMIEIPYRSILRNTDIVRFTSGGSNEVWLMFWLRQPPKLYQRTVDAADRFSQSLATLSSKLDAQLLWLPPVLLDSTSQLLQAGEDKDWDRIEDFTKGNIFGRHNVVGFKFHITQAQPNSAFMGFLNHLYEKRIIEATLYNPSLFILQRNWFHRLDALADYSVLRFNLRYLLEILLAHYNISPLDITYDTVDLLLDDKDVSEVILEHLVSTYYDGQLISNFQDKIKCLLKHCKKIDLAEQEPEEDSRDHVYVRRVFVSPLRVIPCRPELETSNRVLREFPDTIDVLIRIQFVDENCRPLYFTSDFIYDRIKHLLINGIKIAGRTYKYLACSSSQLREHGCWVYCCDASDLTEREREMLNRYTVDELREWMGDFDHIKNPGKYMARLGQCFSSTDTALPVIPSNVDHIPDVWDHTHKYCFSDGIGMISREFATRIAGQLNIRTRPDAFQVRYGGAKGMLAVAPKGYLRRGIHVALRPTQEKFKSDHKSIEICSFAKPIRTYLNRQLIKVLSDLGIEDCVFETLFHDYVKKMSTILTRDGAMEALRVSVGFDAEQPQLGGTASPSMETCFSMLREGFEPQKELFLYQMLQAWRDRALQDLRFRTRIPISKAITLYGVMDETGTLNYGEVYVKFHIRHPESNKPILQDLTGRKVVVGRHPILHPGDVRNLVVRDVKELHHLTDVVVFPKKGPRPHPNEMSGGDLDGDTFFVIYDPRLVPPMQYPPMNYTPPIAPEEINSLEMKKVVEFFVNYMKNDRVGQIANAHMAWADQEPLGTKSEICLELAQLHSRAVDFPKTSIPAAFESKHRPTKYPDFMEKQRGVKEYDSQNVLGRLYRYTKKYSPNSQTGYIERQPVTAHVDHDLIVPGHEYYVKEALHLAVNYEIELSGIAKSFGIWDEGALWTGQVKEFSRSARERAAHSDIQVKLDWQVGELRQKFRFIFDEQLKEAEDWNHLSPDEQKLKRVLKASAWYAVVYEEKYNKRRSFNGKRFLSFAWIMYDQLTKLKNVNSRRKLFPC